MGDEGAQQIETVLKQTSSIEKLNLSYNSIGPNGLQKLCSVLSEPTCTVTTIDITNNNIPDHSLKILLACLYKNDSLQKIHYTVKKEENIKKLEDFKKVEKQSIEKINYWLREEINEHVEIPLWQKIIFPIWCFKYLQHLKHEAFRFKYETQKLK